VDTAIGIGLAVVAALLLAFASAAEHGAANAEPDVRAGGWAMLQALRRRPLWLFGVTSDVSSFAFQAAALGISSLLLVQPLLVLSLLFALPLNARMTGRRISRRDWAWAAVLVAALVVFDTVGQPTAGHDQAPAPDWLPAGAAAVAVVAICMAVATTRRGTPRAVSLAVVTGLTYGVTAAMTIGVVGALDDGIGAVVTSWELYVLIGAATTGWWLQQSAYQAGALTASLPIVMVTEPIVAVVLGVWILDERIRTGPAGWVVIALAAGTIVASVVALARSRAEVDDAVDAAPPTGVSA
jgi:drug/metabolite transporter (DMT)-like permease